MAMELEQTIMNKIGLGANYRWFNGSGSCGGKRRNAVEKLSSAAKEHELSISAKWLDRCRMAIRVDELDGEQYTLTNTWVSCSYAIADAIRRKSGSDGYNPPGNNEGWQLMREPK